jgi:serine/threonine-protein kinase HipA
MLITGEARMSRLDTCIAAAMHFLLDAAAAEDLIARQIETLRAAWPQVTAEANLNAVDERLLGSRLLFNPFIFEGAPARLASLAVGLMR